MTALRTFTFKHRFCSLLLLAVLCFSASPAFALPLSDYTTNLDKAIAELDYVSVKADEESDVDYEARTLHAIDEIRSALPQSQPVEFDGATWTTDNSWLHTALDEALRLPAAERPSRLASLREQLSALRERAQALETSTSVGDDKAAAKQKLESILGRSEYVSGPGGESALGRLILKILRWISEWLPKSSGVAPRSASFISVVVYILVVVVAAVLILYVASLLFNRFKRPLKLKMRKKREARIVLGERLKPEETATDLLSEAEMLARNGDLRAAIRKGYIALLVELGDRNVISLAQYKTNRDYLRSVSSLPQLHPRMKKLTESFERHWYGYAQATPNDWQDFRSGYREALQTAI